MKTHVYFVPGLAANTSIFKHIDLPKEQFELHFLEWIIPKSIDESIANYAKRMCETISETNIVLVGVSFGGIMVQEMAKHVQQKKTVIISSIKTNYELPKRLKIIKTINLYKFFPSYSINSIESFLKFVFGSKFKRQLDKYDEYLSVRNPLYLRWAVHNVLHWNQRKSDPKLIHIHGTKDEIFPIKHIHNCISIEKGSHIMILNKAKAISSILSEQL